MEENNFKVISNDSSLNLEDKESFRKVLKPIRLRETNSFTQDYNTVYQCQRCGDKFFKVTNFCSECGQRLK